MGSGADIPFRSPIRPLVLLGTSFRQGPSRYALTDRWLAFVFGIRVAELSLELSVYSELFVQTCAFLDSGTESFFFATVTRTSNCLGRLRSERCHCRATKSTLAECHDRIESGGTADCYPVLDHND